MKNVIPTLNNKKTMNCILEIKDQIVEAMKKLASLNTYWKKINLKIGGILREDNLIIEIVIFDKTKSLNFYYIYLY